MKAIRTALRRFIFEVFHDKLSYHAYEAGDVAGFAGYYKFMGKVIAYDDTDGHSYRMPYFGW